MNEAFFRTLAFAVDNADAREKRARDGARIVRDAGDYRWVGICDVTDDETIVIACAGDDSSGHHGASSGRDRNADVVPTETTISDDEVSNGIVVPLLGAESAIVIGTLEVRNDRTRAFGPSDIAFLEECAAVLRPLYD